MQRLLLHWLLTVAGLAAVSCVAASEVNPRNVDFSGHWELDYQMSDHPAEKIRWQYIQARSEAARQMERAAHSGYRIDPGVLNYRSIIGLGRLTEIIAQATVLDIRQVEDHIIVNRNDDFALSCDFRDLGVRESVIGEEGCTWQQDQLVFQIALPDGMLVLHRLSLAADRTRLNLATTLQIAGMHYPFTLNRVYMRYEPGEGQYSCEFTVARQTTCTLRGGDSDATGNGDTDGETP